MSSGYEFDIIINLQNGFLRIYIYTDDFSALRFRSSANPSNFPENNELNVWRKFDFFLWRYLHFETFDKSTSRYFYFSDYLTLKVYLHSKKNQTLLSQII